MRMGRLMNKNILDLNKKSWDKIADNYFGKTALPEYGPLIATEAELKLFDDIKGKKVLDIGCGSGHSLRYMANKGAEELWGVDLSSTQVKAAAEYLKKENINAKFFCAPMENDIELPKNYFDIVYSIYAIGWTTDLKRTLELIYSYLKEDGIFIFSWDHPMYTCLGEDKKSLTIEKSYFNEGAEYIESLRGEPVYRNRIRMSTLINELIKVGFRLERLVEGDLSEKFASGKEIYEGSYYNSYKASMVPSSFVIKVRKV